MPEHENLNDSLPQSLADSLTDSLIHRAGPVPQAGPLPGVLRGRLHARRRARRARIAGSAAGVVGVVLLAIMLLVRFGPPTTRPADPTPPNSLIVNNDPPVPPCPPRTEPEPLRIDDPMFAALDRPTGTRRASHRWSIGSYLRGDLPSEL